MQILKGVSKRIFLRKAKMKELLKQERKTVTAFTLYYNPC